MCVCTHERACVPSCSCMHACVHPCGCRARAARVRRTRWPHALPRAGAGPCRMRPARQGRDAGAAREGAQRRNRRQNGTRSEPQGKERRNASRAKEPSCFLKPFEDARRGETASETAALLPMWKLRRGVRGVSVWRNRKLAHRRESAAAAGVLPRWFPREPCIALKIMMHPPERRAHRAQVSGA